MKETIDLLNRIKKEITNCISVTITVAAEDEIMVCASWGYGRGEDCYRTIRQSKGIDSKFIEDFISQAKRQQSLQFLSR